MSSAAKVLPSSSKSAEEKSSKEKRLSSALSSKRKEDSQRSLSKSEKSKKAAKSEKSARSTATTKTSRSARGSESSIGGSSLAVLTSENRTIGVSADKLRRHSPHLYDLYSKGSRHLDLSRYDPTAVGMFTTFLNGKKEHVRGTVSFRAASDLLELAARMDVLSLRTQLEQQLISSAKKSEKAAIQALAIAGRGFGSPRLLRELTSIAAPKFGEMVHEKTFTELPVHVLALLLERCDLAVASELEVADAALLWLSAHRRPSHSAGVLFAQLRGAALHPAQQIEIVERARALHINIKTVQYLAAHLSQRGSCSQHVTAKHVRCVRLPSNAPPPSAKGLPLSTPHPAMACLEEEARSSRSASFLPSVGSQRSTRSTSGSRASERAQKSKKAVVLEPPSEKSAKSQKSGKALRIKGSEKSLKSNSRRRPKSQSSQKSAKLPTTKPAAAKKPKSKRSLKESTKALKKKLSFSRKNKKSKSAKSFKSAKSNKSTKSDKSAASQKSQKSQKSKKGGVA